MRSSLLLALIGAHFSSSARAIEVVFPDCEDASPIEPALPNNASWVDPRIRGGRMLNIVGDLSRGEPLNVIISGQSNPEVLTHEGFKQYSRSIGFSDECLGLHIGPTQFADLGDGIGVRGEQLLMRQTWRRYIPFWGTTCWESFAGGNHFRGWKQNGTMGNTGAWFLATSKEKTGYKDHHMLINDGYNIGRDLLVARALAPDAEWQAEVVWVQGLIEPGIKGINHRIPVDGLVAVITVGERKNPNGPRRSLWSLLRVIIPFPPL